MKISLRLLLILLSYPVYAEMMMDDFNAFIKHCLDGELIQSNYCADIEIVNPQVCKGMAVHLLPINDRTKGQQQSLELEKNYDPAKVLESIDKSQNNKDVFCNEYQLEYKKQYEQNLSRLKGN
ncbi:MAG: hypothetical protein JXQ86_00485 [Methylophilaceae bacterium]